MRKLILLFCLLANLFPAYAKERPLQLVGVHTFIVRLQTKEHRWITDSVTAENENQARTIIYYRYPGCIIYSVQRIG